MDAVTSSPFRVLVVDDEAPCAHVVADLISRSGCCQADVATSGEAGLARLQEESYDVIVLDMVMPGMDGTKFIKSLPPSDRPEIVILSGAMTVRSVVEVMKLGASDCLAKTELAAIEVMVHKAGEV